MTISLSNLWHLRPPMQPDARAFDPRRGPLTAAALGFLAFLYFFDARILDPTRIDWVSSADSATYFLGWHIFRHEAWSWPPGLLKGYATGYGASVGITESIPLAAFLLKPLDAMLPVDFNYLRPLDRAATIPASVLDQCCMTRAPPESHLRGPLLMPGSPAVPATCRSVRGLPGGPNGLPGQQNHEQ